MVTLAACAQGGELPAAPEANAEGSHVAFSSAPTCEGTAPVKRCWGVNEAVGVWITQTPDFRAARNEAVGEWNALLSLGPAPRLVRADDTTFAGVRINVLPGSGPYCGNLDPNSKPFIVTVRPASQCGGTQTAALATLLRHELTAAVGWVDAAEGLSVAGISDNCSLARSTTPPYFRPYVCLHDVEAIFRAYRGVPFPATYWTSQIFSGSNLSTAPITWMQPGATTPRSFTAFTASAPPSAYPVQLARTVTQGTWSVDNSQVATVSSTGLITAVAPGTTTIRLKPLLAAVPPGYLSWTPFELYGDSIRVTVNPPLFRTTDIGSSVAPPFTSAGPVAFSAVTAGAPGTGPVLIEWRVDNSSNGPGWDFTAVQAVPLTWQVVAGAYELKVQATPRQQVGDSLRIGQALIEYFPVCTGGGGGGGGAAAVKGLPGTNAVGGC